MLKIAFKSTRNANIPLQSLKNWIKIELQGVIIYYKYSQFTYTPEERHM